MNTTNTKTGNQSQKRSWLFPLGMVTIVISSVVVVSCFHDDDSTSNLLSDTSGDSGAPVIDDPGPIVVSGTALACDSEAPLATVDASTLKAEAPDSIQAINISFDVNTGDDSNKGSWNNHNAANNLIRMSTTVLSQDPSGEPALIGDGPDGLPGTEDDVQLEVHPLIVSYGEQVIGAYEPGDGSADVGDPDNIDDIFTSLSLDNGKSWKKVKVGDTAKSSSKRVVWGADPNVTTDYPGHSHKPTMQVQDDNILVAWNDKYCPSGDPFDLIDNDTGELTSDQIDTYKVNGTQGSVDYGGIVALPNDKIVYEVPYSCVWTARGEFVLDPEDETGTAYTIQWRQAQQLTSGTRDSNKIWIASFYDPVADEGGFAITWQEDPDGLRPGKGEGPGAGWSGATTNHGADLWYTFIDLKSFDDVCADPQDLDCTTALEDPAPLAILNLGQKPKAAVNFAYPTRITNNEICTPDDFDINDLANSNKPWCATNCDGTVLVESNSVSNTKLERCYQNDVDYMTYEDPPTAAVLDGDTGASRPALKILMTNADPKEYVAVLAYEETKGLSETDPASQTDDTDIALEGKSVYLETFHWDDPVAVSAGNLVNMLVPRGIVDEEGNPTGEGDVDDMIYENARRVVILNQVDPCEQDGGPTFGLLYKQGYDTQGGPSDMFIRVYNGFTHETVAQLDGRDVTNVSSHSNTEPENGTGGVIWEEADLDSQSYAYPEDNTFSPRGWLRGGEVYTGFEYSPRWKATQTGTVPNNFWIHRYVENTWQGPMQISIVKGARISTLDPRFIPTPKGSATSTLESDKKNPDVIFLGYGTFNMDTGVELDLFYTRSTDKGATWEYIDANGEEVIGDIYGADGLPNTADDEVDRLAKLAHREDAHEMELQGLASPDGTMFFGAWLRETATVDNTHQDGMESEFGRVDYDTAK